MARLIKGLPQELKDIEEPKEFYSNWEEIYNAQMKALEDIRKRTHVWTHPIADGVAYYEVVKMVPLELRHLPLFDCHEVHPAFIRGLREEDVMAHKKWEDHFRNISNGKHNWLRRKLEAIVARVPIAEKREK